MLQYFWLRCCLHVYSFRIFEDSWGVMVVACSWSWVHSNWELSLFYCSSIIVITIIIIIIIIINYIQIFLTSLQGTICIIHVLCSQYFVWKYLRILSSFVKEMLLLHYFHTLTRKVCKIIWVLVQRYSNDLYSLWW